MEFLIIIVLVITVIFISYCVKLIKIHPLIELLMRYDHGSNRIIRTDFTNSSSNKLGEKHLRLSSNITYNSNNADSLVVISLKQLPYNDKSTNLTSIESIKTHVVCW